MSTSSTSVIGGYQTDFARNTVKEGASIADLFGEAVQHTLASAGIAPADVDVIHVGNAFGQLFTGQGQLGGMPATVEPALWGIPAMRHEAACASGSMAILSAMAEIEAGRYDVALVIGAEIEKTVGGDLGAQYLGAAAWIGNEGQEATFMWPYMFDKLADEYDRRYGLDDAHLHAIAELNVRNARSNPNAQTRGWSFTPGELHRRRRREPIGRGSDPAHRLQRHDRRRRRGGAGLATATWPPTRTSRGGRARGSSAGDTARSASPCSRSSTTPPTSSTCCRTSGRPSSTRSTGPASPTSTNSTRSRRTTASR